MVSSITGRNLVMKTTMALANVTKNIKEKV